MASDHSHAHAGEIASDGRFQRVEIGMRIGPNDAAMCVREARECACTDITASSQHQGKPPRLNDLPNCRSEPLAHSQRCAPAVVKWSVTINPLHVYDNACGCNQLRRAWPL